MASDLITPGRLRVGYNRRANPERAVVVVSNNTGSFERGCILIESFEGAAIRPTINLSKFRGTPEVPVIVQVNDTMGGVEWNAYTGVQNNCANINAYVDAAPVANQTSASRIEIETAQTNAPARLVAYVSREGYVGIGTAFFPNTAATRATAPLHVVGSAAGAGLDVRFDAYEAANEPRLALRRARGTLLNPATVVNGDGLLSVRSAAYTNAWHEDLAGIRVDVSAAVVAGQAPKTTLRIYANANNAAAVNIATAESTGMRIGDAGYNAQFKLHVIGGATGTQMRIQNNFAGATADGLNVLAGDNAVIGSKFLQFTRPDFTEIGSIQQNAAGTVIYNIASDRRIKADIVDSPLGLAEVLRMQPRQFRYLSDASKRIMFGFIAQEMNAIFPDAVSPGDDAPELVAGARQWGMDYGRITPVLVRALQELAARVEALEA